MVVLSLLDVFVELTSSTARMLTSPIRFCAMTQIRLPSHFLSSFSVLYDPRTGKPWLNPDDTDIDFLGKHDLSGSNAGTTVHNPESSAPDSATPTPKDGQSTDSLASYSEAGLDTGLTALPLPSTSASSRLPASQPRTRPPSFQVCSSTLVLDEISSLRSRQKFHFIPRSWKEEKGIQPRDTVWRKDMPEYVLRQMRDEAMKGLLYLSSRPGTMYLVPIREGWSGMDKAEQVSALLWTGLREVANFTPETSEDSIALVEQNPIPPPYAMFDWRKRRTPIYNLLYLLGEENVKRLVESAPRLKCELIAIKRKSNTAGLQMLLWKLMGHLAGGKGKSVPMDEGI